MNPSAEGIKARERFLTPNLYEVLSNAKAFDLDYFTASETPPKTFKVAQCTLHGDDKADVHVQVYWRDDPKVTQREVHVETVKSGDAWLINKVSN